MKLRLCISGSLLRHLPIPFLDSSTTSPSTPFRSQVRRYSLAFEALESILQEKGLIDLEAVDAVIRTYEEDGPAGLG